MKLSLIAAIGKNREIGFGNKLPWRLPDDLKRFKEITRGHAVIMGRKTFESLGETAGVPGRPLPERKNIIVTRDKTYIRHGVDVVHSLEEALKLCANDPGPFVIGGGDIFSQALPHAEKMYLTHVDTGLPADSFFPEFDSREWQIVSEEFHPKDDRHPFGFTFRTYTRK
jgi:dihydrofolate reductase